MKNITIFLLILVGFSFYGTTCREEVLTNCEIGLCPPMYIYINLSNTSDTMYVGDTLELRAQVPNRVFEFNRNGDTIWHNVVNFNEQAMDYTLYFLDVNTGAIKATPPKVTIIKEVGGSYEDRTTFSTSKPYEFSYKIIFNSPGVYFFQTAFDNGYNLNGETYMRGAILEWDVPYKNFELLRAWGEERYNAAIGSDYVDAYNYFPFEVIER